MWSCGFGKREGKTNARAREREEHGVLQLPAEPPEPWALNAERGTLSS